MMMPIWHHRQTWNFFISALYHTGCMPYTSNIAWIYDIGFFDTQFWSNCHFYICCPFCFENSQSDWKHVGRMLFAVLWRSYVQFWTSALLKVVPLFLDHPIYVFILAYCKIPVFILYYNVLGSSSCWYSYSEIPSYTQPHTEYITISGNSVQNDIVCPNLQFEW